LQGGNIIPRVDPAAFGARTVKLPPLLNLSYTVQAAVEMFAAAAAPAGFYGNAYSTFSRGVGLLRASQPGAPSLAYDCGISYEAHRSNFSQYHALKVVEPAGCERGNALRVRGETGSLEPPGTQQDDFKPMRSRLAVRQQKMVRHNGAMHKINPMYIKNPILNRIENSAVRGAGVHVLDQPRPGAVAPETLHIRAVGTARGVRVRRPATWEELLMVAGRLALNNSHVTHVFDWQGDRIVELGAVADGELLYVSSDGIWRNPPPRAHRLESA
jgi:hypothetical protein